MDIYLTKYIWWKDCYATDSDKTPHKVANNGESVSGMKLVLLWLPDSVMMCMTLEGPLCP